LIGLLKPKVLADHAKDDWIDGQKTEDVVSFLDRLFTARRKVEERIVALGGVEESKVGGTHLYHQYLTDM
jgi:sorting nexin-25